MINRYKTIILNKSSFPSHVKAASPPKPTSSNLLDVGSSHKLPETNSSNNYQELNDIFASSSADKDNNSFQIDSILTPQSTAEANKFMNGMFLF